MSFSPDQIGDLEAVAADLLSLTGEVRNPSERYSVFVVATLVNLLARNPAMGASGISALGRRWKIKEPESWINQPSS